MQVNGVQVFVDLTGITMAHSTNLMTPENGKKMLQFYQVRFFIITHSTYLNFVMTQHLCRK